MTKDNKISKMLKCRQCGSDVNNMMGYGPFCSARCRTLDLGSWALEKYYLPVENEIQSITKPVEYKPKLHG